MSYAESFPYVAAPNARVLVLGSMPGKASLAKQQYYGHPQNCFWRIMASLFGLVAADDLYEERLKLLVSNRIALWDVVRACIRPGSLDASIIEESIVPNDFPAFLAEHQQIRAVFFNGQKSQHAFRKHVWQQLSESQRALHFQRLPSTSPANAKQSYQQKLAEWQIVHEYARD